MSEPRYVSPEACRELIERLEPKADSSLYGREGEVLGSELRIPLGIPLCLGQRLMLIRAGADTRAAFLEIAFNWPFNTKTPTAGGAAPRENRSSTVRAYPNPFPPLAEQNRIVKFDALLDPLLKEALVVAEDSELEAAE